MQIVSLPKLGGFVVVKNRISVVDTLKPGCYPNIRIFARRASNGGHAYDQIHIPYPLDVGEWYKVNSINYPRKSWDSFAGVPWFTLALHRTKRRWCKDKVAKLIQEATMNMPDHDHITISSVSINLMAKDCNNKLYWVETESEASKLSAELQNRILTLPDPEAERWTTLKEEL